MSRCKDLFIAASELSPTARGAFLDSSCGTDAVLRAEVEKLLGTLDGSADFLETPAVHRPDRIVVPPQIGPGRRIGPYTITELLGEGGMGVVWQADQAEPVRRKVALKLLKPALHNRHVIARFEAERRALERMDHPNIAHVLDAGTTDDGRPFVVMELVRGTAATKYCDAHALSVLERIQLFIPVCRAVQHAHSKGVIHRDLKPSNILVCEEDGRATPKIIDFGIARSVERSPDETNHTRALVLLGTPSYVSPEQALKGSEVDTRTDVYSLGAVLYELICGAPPFDPQMLASLPADALLRTLRNDDPPRPSRRVLFDRSDAVAAARGSSPFGLQRQLKGDVDRIAMKTLEKEPSRRYETAAALADDLERFLRHDPVTATDPSTPYVVAKFILRHRAGAIATLLVLSCLVVGTIVSWLLAKRAIDAEQQARIALEEATANEQRYRRQAFISDMNLADDALRRDDPKRLKELLDLHVPVKNETDLRSFAWHFLRRRSSVPTRVIDRLDVPFYFVTFSPDRTTLAATAADGKVRFYDAKTFRPIRTLDAGQGEVNSVAYSPDGTRFATAGDDGTVKFWDADNLERLRTIQVFDESAYQTAFVDVPDGLWIAVNGINSEVRLFDAMTGEPRGKPLPHGAPVEAIAASRDGLLATASEDRIPRVWNVATGELVRKGPKADSNLISAAFSPNGRWLLFGQVSAEFLIWDMGSDGPPRAFPTNSARPGEGEAAQSFTFLGSNRSIALADRGGVIRLARLNRKGTPMSDPIQGRYPHWVAHQDRIYSSASSRDGTLIVTAGRDGLLKASRPLADRLVPDDDGTGLFSSFGAVTSVAAGPDEIIGVGGSEGPFLLDLDRRTFLQVSNELKPCEVIARSDDGRLVVGGNADVGLVAWRRTGEEFEEIWKRSFGERPAVQKIRLTRDGRYVAALVSPRTSEAKSVFLIDASNGKQLAVRSVAGSFGLDFNPDGTLLAVGQDSDVLVLSLPSFDEVQRLKGHRQSVPAICFSPDGRWLATGAGDRKATLWDTRTWEPSPWVAAGGELKCISFTPDGRTLLTASTDGIPALWDLQTKRLLMHLPRIEGEYWPLRFTGSGDRIVGGHPKRGLYIFDGRPMNADDARPINRR